MARVPKVACETISRGTPRLRNLPRNSGQILYFRKIAIKFRQTADVKNLNFLHCITIGNIAKLIQNIPKAAMHTFSCNILCEN